MPLWLGLELALALITQAGDPNSPTGHPPSSADPNVAGEEPSEAAARRLTTIMDRLAQDGLLAGQRAYGQRDYALAAEYLRAGQRHGTRWREFEYYELYALCMAGRLDEAREWVQRLGVAGGDENDQRVAKFLSETFGLARPEG